MSWSSDEPLDIGHGVSIVVHRWDGDPYAIAVRHQRPDGTSCACGVSLDTAALLRAYKVDPPQTRWAVESLEPLTISPSVLCLRPGCGAHGYIRGGRWVPS